MKRFPIRINTLTDDSSKAELILRSEVEVNVSNILRRDGFEDDLKGHGIELRLKKYFFEAGWKI